MTVCVAAIFDNTGVIGLADRMVTTGDMQAQPARSKIVRLSNSIFAMYAGDIALATELLSRVAEAVGDRIRTRPEAWWGVVEVAALWRSEFLAHRAQAAEAAILAPVGLTQDSFLSRQKELSDDFIRTIASELVNFQVGDVDVIFAGVDPKGPHVYLASGAEVVCRDGIGFAAIGSGSYHARSQMIFAQHTADVAAIRAMASLYLAKRRAEFAPGVGAETDSVVVYGLGSTDTIHDDLMSDLRQACDEEERRRAEAFTVVETKLNESLERLITRTAVDKQEAPKAGDASPPAA